MISVSYLCCFNKIGADRALRHMPWPADGDTIFRPDYIHDGATVVIRDVEREMGVG